MAHCMAEVALFITKANPWNCGTSCSINCDLLFHCKSLLKECEYSVIQLVFMTKFQTEFTSSVWSFCHWVAYVPPHETSPSGNEQGERSVFAGWVIEQLRCSFWFILLLFPVNVVMDYYGFNKVLRRWKSFGEGGDEKSLQLFLGKSRGIPPPPSGKFTKSRPLTIHFQHSGAKMRVLNRTQTSLNFGLCFQWQQMNIFF